MHIGTRLVSSQGRTVRGLSVRKAGQCEACRAHRHISIRLVSSSSKVQTPVGQQYNASIRVQVQVRGHHDVFGALIG